MINFVLLFWFSCRVNCMIRPFLSEVDFACEVTLFQDTQTFHNFSGLLQFTTRSEQEVNIMLTTHIGDLISFLIFMGKDLQLQKYSRVYN